MMAAAACAAFTCAASRCCAASACRRRVKSALREALAAASATAQICRSLRPGAPAGVSTLPRLSCKSRAKPGSASRMLSRVFISGRLQSLFALLPIAGTGLVGLQGIEHAQHFLGAAPAIEIGDVDEADHALRIDDEGGALGHARLRIENPERAGELALDVSEHREGERAQLVFLAAPGEVHVLAVDADPEQLRIARPELLLQLAESRNLRRADEGEILGPEEHDLPLAGEAVTREGLERIPAVGRDDAGEVELGELMADACHANGLLRIGTAHAAPHVPAILRPHLL